MAVWEIHDQDFTEIACQKCAYEFLLERNVADAELGKNYSDGILSVTEDTHGQHDDCKHRCFGCERWIEPDKTPCNNCGEMIASDIHAEELGMCVDCSNAYFSHDD